MASLDLTQQRLIKSGFSYFCRMLTEQCVDDETLLDFSFPNTTLESPKYKLEKFIFEQFLRFALLLRFLYVTRTRLVSAYFIYKFNYFNFYHLDQ